MAADYYELLGVAARRHAGRASSAPTAGWPASCTPTPTRTTRGRGAVQGGRPGLRDAVAIPSSGAATTVRARAARPGRRRRPVRRRRWLGDLFDAFFGGGGRSAAARGGPSGRPGAPTSRWSLDLDVRGRGVRHAGAGRRCAPRSPATTCDGHRRGSGHARRPRAPDCGGAGQVRRVRQSILGQMVTAGPAPAAAASAR